MWFSPFLWFFISAETVQYTCFILTLEYLFLHFVFFLNVTFLE